LSLWHGTSFINGGDGYHIWRMAVNMLNMQSQTADSGLFSGTKLSPYHI